MKHFYFLCMFFGIICIFSSCSKEEEPMKVEPRILLNKTDSLVMLDVYDKTGGGVYWGKTWDRGDYNPWTDVKTEEINGEYRIVNIQISPSAVGSLPATIGQLAELRILYLNGNIVGGLPATIANLTKLEILSVTATALGGEIPKEIGEVKRLKRLYLINNGMTGEIPVELGQLSGLMLIDLSHNHFYGTVPLTLLENPNRGVTLNYNDLTVLSWDCWLDDKYNIPSMLHNRLSGKVPENVRNTERWKDYKWLVGTQQEGYGYIE